VGGVGTRPVAAGAGGRPGRRLGETLRGALLLAYGVLLGIGALFAGIVAVLELYHWPETRTFVGLMAVLAALMAAGAWLAFEFSETEGLGTSTEWAPDSPP
jgi:hypothetical protein